MLLLLLLGGAWCWCYCCWVGSAECWAVLLLRWGAGLWVGRWAHPSLAGIGRGAIGSLVRWFVGSWHCRLQVHIALRTKLLNSC